jgi:hypothetical protein
MWDNLHNGRRLETWDNLHNGRNIKLNTLNSINSFQNEGLHVSHA